jgi:hypothetical protein
MLLQSKSNLARLMATENIFIEQKKVSTAFFDLENRTLTIPVLNGKLSAELYDLLLGHEVGHALETPKEGWHHSVVDLKVNRTILNVCEDARIEKKIKRKFPGIRPSFLKGYRELMDMDFFGVKGHDLNYLNFIDRLNLYTKGGSAQGIEFLPVEEELLREVEETETFDEVVKVALKIQEYMKQSAEEEKNLSLTDIFIDLDELEESDYDEGDDFYEDVFEVGGSKSNSKENKSKEDKKSKLRGAGLDGSIDSETDKTFREKENLLRDSSSRYGSVYANIPKLNLENIIVPYSYLMNEFDNENKKYSFYSLNEYISNFNKFKNESSKVVSYLVKEFELRKNAEQQSKVRISKTGDLNMNRIHEYKLTDDIFARLASVPNGKSHGLIMFIDWSGSMTNHMNNTVRQLLNLVLFCKKINIPFDVYGFSTHLTLERSMRINDNEDILSKEVKIGDLSPNPFSLLHLLSSKMKVREFTKMCSILLGLGAKLSRTQIGKPLENGLDMSVPNILSLSGTPLNEAILACFEIIPKFKTDNKVQVVNTVFLTDGEGSTIYGYYEEQNARKLKGFNNYRDRIIFRDPVTKAIAEVYDTIGNPSTQGTDQSIALLRLLKQRTDSNIVGFYITSSQDARASISNFITREEKKSIDTFMSEFRRNKYAILQNAGFDEYYFLRSNDLVIDDENDFEVSSTTTRALVSAFSKYTTNRITNRIVLNRFIQLIA